MAHLESYTRKDMTKITKEAYREHKNQSAYKNNVDLSKSHLNYSMMGLDRKGFLERLDARCIAVMQGKRMQTQTKVIGSWVHTCPEELRGNPVTEKAFFKECYEFAKTRYGEENVIDAVVHYDEGSPHMTVYVCPGCKSRKTGKQTISSASMFTRTDLQRFHPALDKALEKRFGQSGLALNGRTKGDFTLEELRERTRVEQALTDRETAVSDGEAKLQQEKQDFEIEMKRRKKQADDKDKEQNAREIAQNALQRDLEVQRDKTRLILEDALRMQNTARNERKEAGELLSDIQKIGGLPTIGKCVGKTKDGQPIYLAGPTVGERRKELAKRRQQLETKSQDISASMKPLDKGLGE